MISPHILVVDDHQIMRNILVRLLRSKGYRVLETETAPQAMSAVSKSRVDVALVDIELGNPRVVGYMDGLSLCRELKANPETNHIQIIMLTSHKENTYVLSSLQAGAVDFVVKPYDPVILLEKIRRVLEKMDLSASGNSTQESGAAVEAGAPVKKMPRESVMSSSTYRKMKRDEPGHEDHDKEGAGN